MEREMGKRKGREGGKGKRRDEKGKRGRF